MDFHLRMEFLRASRGVHPMNPFAFPTPEGAFQRAVSGAAPLPPSLSPSAISAQMLSDTQGLWADVMHAPGNGFNAFSELVPRRTGHTDRRSALQERVFKAAKLGPRLQDSKERAIAVKRWDVFLHTHHTTRTHTPHTPHIVRT